MQAPCTDVFGANVGLCGDGSDTFVTKVRLVQIKRDKNLGVADILTQWQQEPIKKGDVIFY